MNKKINVEDPLMVKFDKEIFEEVKKIVKKTAEDDKLDDLLEYDYWTEDAVIEVEVPVIIKKSKRETMICRKYMVSMNISIQEHD